MTPPSPWRRQPWEKAFHQASAQQSSWALEWSEFWQQAQGWRWGRLGQGPGHQPGLPQVPQHVGPPAQQSMSVSCSSIVVFSNVHWAEFLVAGQWLQPVIETQTCEVIWLQSHSNKARARTHTSSEKYSAISDLWVPEIVLVLVQVQ